MNHTVTVQTGARLHFGLLAIAPPRGRQFGGAGLMIAQPGFQLAAIRAADGRDMLRGGSDSVRRRIATFLQRARDAVPREAAAPLDIAVQSEIPGHSGLGSGTQLGLAIATIVSAFAGEPMPTVAERAQRVGRGRRSAVGLHGFGVGGLLVDGGQRSVDEISPLVARVEWPVEWTWLLVSPPEREGLSGVAEQHAFQRLVSMGEPLTAKLCRTLLLDLLPSVLDRDFASTSAALWEYGRSVGEYFLPVQHGLFADPQMARLVDYLRLSKIAGVVQTSWGPTIAILCPDADAAAQLEQDLRQNSPWSDCTIQAVAALNTGATITWT